MRHPPEISYQKYGEDLMKSSKMSNGNYQQTSWVVFLIPSSVTKCYSHYHEHYQVFKASKSRKSAAKFIVIIYNHLWFMHSS